MTKFITIDTSNDLHVIRWRSGVKLIKPEDLISCDEDSITSPSIKDLFEMPFNVYFLDTQSVIRNMSDRTASICGFQDKTDAIGNTARAVCKKISADFSIQHNNEVMSNNLIIIKDEHFLRLDDFEFHDLSIKLPLLNNDGKVIGVFGCSIIKNSLAQSLNFLLRTGLLVSSNNISSQYDPGYLIQLLSTEYKQPILKREAECLALLLRGKSARETGIELNLSQRTVEYYLDSLKDKLNVRKKSEIVGTIFNLLNE